MSSVRLTVQELVTFIEGKPNSVKTLGQNDRKLLKKSFSIFQETSKEAKFEKKLTDLKGLIVKLEQNASSKSLKKYCSYGFFHFIRSIFKGFANAFGRISTKDLASNAHKIYENYIKKTFSLSLAKTHNSTSVSPVKSTPIHNKEETFATHYDNFKSLQLQNYMQTKGTEPLDQDPNLPNSIFFQQWMTSNLFKNYLIETVSIIGTKVQEGIINENDLDQTILQFIEIGILSKQNELGLKFDALRRDLYKHKSHIINHFQNKAEFEYREKCIEMFYKASKHHETIMKLYDQDEKVREEFWKSADRYYPNHKHKFASNQYVEKHFGFVLHAENPRPSVETALKFGPPGLIEAYEKAKSMDEETLEEFFIRAFNRADACFEIKNTTIGDFIADISSNMNDKPLIDANKLINSKLTLTENADAICDEFIDRKAREFCRDNGKNLAKSLNRWTKQKIDIETDDKFNKDYINSNQLYNFLKDEVKAIGKKVAIHFEDETQTNITEEYEIQESDLKEMVNRCVDILMLIERSPE